MFENIIGHIQITAYLREIIANGNIPGAFLFSGPENTGKMTTALEFARAVSCEKRDAPWGCLCRSCIRHRSLMQQNTFLIGYRNCLPEIHAAFETAKRNNQTSSRFLIIRAVMKFIKRFDEKIWENENQKINKSYEALRDLQERLESIYPVENGMEQELPEKKLKSVVDICEKLQSDLHFENIPVDVIRNIRKWVYTSNNDMYKIFILDNADRLNDSGQNALLKVLEDPPPATVFILLTTNRNGLLPTVLSRCRPIIFPERSNTEVKDILSRVFKENTNEYKTLGEFFMAWEDINIEQLHNRAVQFIDSILIHDHDFIMQLPDFIVQINSKEKLPVFFRELGRSLKEKMYHRFGNENLYSWQKKIDEIYQRIRIFNQSPDLAVESLYYNLWNMQ